MTASPDPAALELEEQVARIRRMNAETGKLVEEGLKRLAEGRKLQRERSLAPLAVAFSGMTAGAALFGAGVAFARLFGP